MKNGKSQTLPCWQRETLDEVSAVMRQMLGLDVSRYEVSFLAKMIEKRRQATGSETSAAYLERLAAERDEAKKLRDSLTVSYSEFFRNPLTFALLEHMVLPGLIEAKIANGQDEVRVWSAGCAAGQEAYSVAILLEELIAVRESRLTYRIFATDQSEPDLAQARAGVYSAMSAGNVCLRHLGPALERKGDAFGVVAKVRERVDFSTYDLLEGETSFPPASIYGGFDLVMCCNVLLYYRPESRRIIADKLRRGLAAGGYLVTGEAERELVEQAGGFRSVMPFSAVFQKV